MSKIDRVLSLLSLLSHRRSVTIEAIKEAVGIPPRTAYRYLNTLSEANIPLVHDKHSGGYQLLKSPELALPTLTENELLILGTVLLFSRHHVNKHYKIIIQSMFKKLCAKQHIPLERIVLADGMSDLDEAMPDYSSAITDIILEVAVRENRRITVVCENHATDNGSIEIREPKLAFNGTWRISGTTDEGVREIPVRSVTVAAVGVSSIIEAAK